MLLNEAWTIVKPSLGEYSPDCLKLETRPVVEPVEGQVLLETIYLSLDPTSRNWLKLAPSSNVFNLKVGSVMIGQAVSRVLKSASPDLTEGDLVVGASGWERYSVADTRFVRKVRPDVPLEANLTIFSHIGMAAISGIVGVGNVKEGETVVVSAAAGATGSIACSIAKARGARVIGIASGPDKCAFLEQTIGVDAAVDYKNQDVEQRLAELCPRGIDLFFDNVGGGILDAVLMNLAVHGRIAVCGQMALYDSDDRQDGQGVRNLMELVFRQANMQGFLAGAGETPDRIQEYNDELTHLFKTGAIQSRSHIVKGLDRAAESLLILLQGRNEGKLLVQVSEPPAEG